MRMQALAAHAALQRRHARGCRPAWPMLRAHAGPGRAQMMPGQQSRLDRGRVCWGSAQAQAGGQNSR